MAAKQPTVVFFPEGAYGPKNNCLGIGSVLKRRGARVVFVIEESFAGASDFDTAGSTSSGNVAGYLIGTSGNC